MDVSLFVTCLADTLFPGVGRATVEVLERLGCRVRFPTAQTCCGQMHMNSGYPTQAASMVEAFAHTFADAEAVVVPSGSCAAMLREHGSTPFDLTGQPAPQLPPVHELTEFLVDVLGVTDVGAVFPHTVTYHPACHSLRLLGLGERPYQLLRAVRGLQLLDLPDADRCCGFGGTFAMKEADVSNAMGTDKVDRVVGTGAEYLCTVDTSCAMHLQGVADRQRKPLRTIHLAEILASRS